MTKSSLRAAIQKMRPDVRQDVGNNELKRKLALGLRALRKKKGLTQKQVEMQSGLTQPMISRLEAPTGPLPNWETVMRYVAACNGHMLVGFSAAAFSEEDFLTTKKAEEVYAIAV